MPKYRCPKCGREGYLVLTEDKDYSTGTFSYRVRMIHVSKDTRKECLLTTLRPQQLKRKKRGRKKKKISKK